MPTSYELALSMQTYVLKITYYLERFGYSRHIRIE